MTRRLEIAPQGMMVINLTVEHDGDRPVFVRDRLITTRDVDDAESAHPHRHPVGHEIAVRIRASVQDGIAHRAQSFANNIAAEPHAREPGYSTHRVTSKGSLGAPLQTRVGQPLQGRRGPQVVDRAK